MKALKVTIISFGLLTCCLLITCKDEDDNELIGTIPVNIADVLIPKTGQLDQAIEILIYAEAPNGCFSDLKVTMRQTGSQHYLFRATGYYELHDECLVPIASIDTMIIFEPPSAGEFYFQANEDPFPILRDTLAIF